MSCVNENLQQTMKNYLKFHNPLLWGLFAILFGGLLLYWQREFLHHLIMIMGGISILVGVIQLLTFMHATKGVEKRWHQFPLSVVITVIVGILLLSNAPQWTEIFIAIVGVIMAMLGLLQIQVLRAISKRTVGMSKMLYLFPILLMLSGAGVIIYRNETANWIVIFCGVWMLLYGISEVATYFSFNLKGGSISPSDNKTIQE